MYHRKAPTADPMLCSSLFIDLFILRINGQCYEDVVQHDNIAENVNVTMFVILSVTTFWTGLKRNPDTATDWLSSGYHVTSDQLTWAVNRTSADVGDCLAMNVWAFGVRYFPDDCFTSHYSICHKANGKKCSVLYVIRIFRIISTSIYLHSLRNKQVEFNPYSHQTADQPRPMSTNFYGLVGYDRVKNNPLWMKSVSIPDQHPLYPRCIPDAPTLKSRSSRPTPVHPADQSPLCTTNPRPIPDTTTLTTLNIGPTPDLISTPVLKRKC